MGRISDATKERILDAADIVDVVGEFVELKKKGQRYIGLCPFHDDKHATNFSVYPAKQCFTCFACGAKGGVIEFLKRHEGLSFPDALRWLGKRYNILVDDEPLDYTPPPPRPKPKPKDMLVLPMSMVYHTQKLDNDTLVQWLRSLPFDAAQSARIDKVLEEYHIGHSKQGMTIFWQIDEQQRVRTGKMMRYKADGHRDKESRYGKDWIHSILSGTWKNGIRVYEAPWPHPDLFNPDNQEMKQCLFGMHLLNKYKGADVKIVESEKTAILMAVAYGNHEKNLWMACGGLENISFDKLSPIIAEGRRIILYPDRDGIDKWRQKVSALNYNNIEVDAKPVTEWWKPCDGEKADIADVIIRNLLKRQ